MAGGPIAPRSVYLGGQNGKLFQYFYAGAGGNAAPNEEGDVSVMASLNADAVLQLRYHMPPQIPTGTLKLRVIALANATSGAAKLTVSDGIATPATSPSSSGNPSTITLTSETQTTVTWAASENDRYKEAKVTLTSTPAANDVLVVAITFQTSGWTLAQISTWKFDLIWE